MDKNEVLAEVAEATVEQASIVKKAAPVVLPAVVLFGLGFLGFRVWKNRKAKKNVLEVNPPVSE